MAEQTKSQYRKPHPNVIEGWQNKKYNMSPADLSGLVPFIKLYGIIGESERQLYLAAAASTRNGKPKLPPGFIESFNNAVELDIIAENTTVKTINNALVGEDNANRFMIDMTPSEAQGPKNNWTGGFGIKDLKCSRDTASPFSETFSLEVQLNDPTIIRRKYEYNKLLTVGSNFLLLYGWSSGGPTAGYDTENRTYTVDYSDNSYYNGRDWRFAFIQLHKFNWDFNQLGQMSGTLDFIAAQNSELLFNMGGKMSTLSKSVMYFMNSRLLGGPEGADRAVDLIGTYNIDGEAADITVGETTLSESMAQSIFGSDFDSLDIEGSDRNEETARIVQLAMMGFLGPQEIWIKVGRGGRSRAPFDAMRSAWNNNTTYSFDGKTIGPALANLAQNNPGQFRKQLSSAGFSLVGIYLEGGGVELGFETNKGGLFYQAPPGWGPNQKNYLIGRGAMFVPIVYNPNIEEQDLFDPNIRGSASRVSYRIYNKTKLDDDKINFVSETGQGGNGNLRERFSGGPDDIKNFQKTLSIADSRFDKLFFGRARFQELEISEKWRPTFENLPEGIIITKRGMGTAPEIRSSSGSRGAGITTGTAHPSIILGEDIFYYYLGWVVEAFKYYNYKFSNKRINVEYAELGVSQVSQPFAQFQNQFRSRIAKATARELGDDVAYNYDQYVGLKDPADINGSNYSVKSDMIPNNRGNKGFAYEQDSEGNKKYYVGVYYSEIKDLVPNLVSPDSIDRSFFNAEDAYTPPNRGDVKFIKFLHEKHAKGADRGATYFRGYKIFEGETTAGKSRDFSIMKKGNEIFFPIGTNLPTKVITAPEGDEESDDDFREIESTGLITKNITNTAEVILDADKVDDILNDSVGQSFPDVMNKILTTAVAMPELGLMINPNSNGTLVIEAAGALTSDEQQFNMDFNPEIDSSVITEGPNFIIDYRTKHSLLAGINVSAKMDPNIAFLYGSSVRSPGGRSDIVKLAAKQTGNWVSADGEGLPPNPNLPNFDQFARNWMLRNRPNDQELLRELESFATQINKGQVRQEGVEGVLEKLPEGLFAEYMSQDYTLYEQLAVEQMNNNGQLSQMFSYYMNQITVTIHGTCGLECMQIVQLKNVAGLLDGYYCIIGITDSVGSSNFETELNLMLVVPSTLITPTG